jgi:hypothetical protein
VSNPSDGLHWADQHPKNLSFEEGILRAKTQRTAKNAKQGLYEVSSVVPFHNAFGLGSLLGCGAGSISKQFP